MSFCASLLVALGGCAGYEAFREGQSALAEGQIESGVAKLKEAAEAAPRNSDFRRTYFVERDRAVGAYLARAEDALDQARYEEARDAFRKVLQLDPANARAIAGEDRVSVAERHAALLNRAVQAQQAGNQLEAKRLLEGVLAENPAHRRASTLLRSVSRQQNTRADPVRHSLSGLGERVRKPVSFTLHGVSLLQFLDAVRQATGINYVLDRDVRPDIRVTLSVTGKPLEDALRLVLLTSQLEARLVGEDTIYLYPNTPQKAAEHRELIVRTFHLNHAEAGKIASALRTLVRTKDIVVDDRLNLVMIRDTPEAVRLAERLILSKDVPEPEVMLELEVLEVSSNRLTNIGIDPPTSISGSVSGVGRPAGQLSLSEFRNPKSGLVSINLRDPLVAAQLRGQRGEANLLANPRIRVRNKQSAKVLIGERVPVFTTISTANVGTSESVTYLDVGLKLDIEPSISMDGEVSMKIALEVSNILDTITRTSGTQAYRLGTRNTATSLRVRDGETNVLGGLIQRDERSSSAGLPGVSELPLLGRLFGVTQDNNVKTEIILLITPRIVRNIESLGPGLQEFRAGTDAFAGVLPEPMPTEQADPAPPKKPAGTP